MSRDDTDITSGKLDNLDLPCCAARERKLLVRETAQTEQIVGCLVHMQQFGRFGERVDADAVLEHHDDAFST